MKTLASFAANHTDEIKPTPQLAGVEMAHFIRPPDRYVGWPWINAAELSFLPIHCAQQPRSGWPSNVFRRFGCRLVAKASLIDPEISPTPSVIFTEGQNVHHSTLSCPRLKMHQGTQALKLSWTAAMIALCIRQVW